MFSKRKNVEDNKISKESEVIKQEVPKYPKPKILLIDMNKECGEVLRKSGYNLKDGSFGKVYEIEKSSKIYPVSIESCILPNCSEQEIIFANINKELDQSNLKELSENLPGRGVVSIWQDAKKGIIDPRTYSMNYLARDYFERIYGNGGIFIVFIYDQKHNIYYRGPLNGDGNIKIESGIPLSNWGFLKELKRFKVNNIHGYEITFDTKPYKINSILEKASKDAEYFCTITPHDDQKDSYISLAKNKYGEDVAGVLFYPKLKGLLFLLPQMPNFYLIIQEFIEKICAEIKPELFPHLEGWNWIHRPEYEIHRVLELRDAIEKIELETNNKMNHIKDEIKKIQEDNSDIYTLIRGTGDELVKAVIKSFGNLGFIKITDVDAELEQTSENRNLREDIQIHDKSPVLIIDVKGVQGTPDDAESTQAEKHAIMRIREWSKTDVQPLTIVNHQRNLPPHDRDQKAFRDEIIKNAEKTRLGLMTTWDIFKILRNFEKFK